MTDTPAATGETYFFRDRGQFDLLRFRLLPELIGRRREAKILRLWSAGCASGEEAYSLAMLVDMLLPEREEWDILILGTDIDPAALEKARRGRYGQWSFRLVSAGLQRRYFRREGEEWELDEGIREMARFRALDLIGGDFPDAELRDMDLILCRNVFIYFRPEEVERVAAKMAAALSEGGYLMTGHTELMGHTVAGLTSRLFPEGVVYQGAVSAGRPSPPATLPLPQGASPPGSRCFAATTARQGGRVEKAPPSSWGRGCGEGTPGIPAAPPLVSARELADRGEYEKAEKACREDLAADPLDAQPYFLLAQLAQIRGDFGQARELLEKTLYLDPRSVAACLELAALHERAGELTRVHTLRTAALEILRSLPPSGKVEPYEITAGELAEWLARLFAVNVQPEAVGLVDDL